MFSIIKKPNYNVRTKVLYQMVPSNNRSQRFLFFILYLQISQHPSLMLHMTYQCPAQHLYIFLFIPNMNSVHLHFNSSIPTLLCHFPFIYSLFWSFYHTPQGFANVLLSLTLISKLLLSSYKNLKPTINAID